MILVRVAHVIWRGAQVSHDFTRRVLLRTEISEFVTNRV